MKYDSHKRRVERGIVPFVEGIFDISLSYSYVFMGYSIIFHKDSLKFAFDSTFFTFWTPFCS